MQRNKALRALCLLCCISIMFCWLAPNCMAQEATAETLIAEITTQKGPLKLREQPSKHGKVLCEIPRGTFVVVAAYDEEWFAASYNGLQGYIMTAYATLTEGVDSNIFGYQTLQMGDCGDFVLA